MNSNGPNEGNGFYSAFSADFKSTLVTVNLPAVIYEGDIEGINYNNYYVFMPSATELGLFPLAGEMSTSRPYEYFNELSTVARSAKLGSDYLAYWTRTAVILENDTTALYTVDGAGNLELSSPAVIHAARPGVNLNSQTRVFAQTNSEGLYEIVFYSNPTQ